MATPTLKLIGGPSEYLLRTADGRPHARILWTTQPLTARLMPLDGDQPWFTLSFDPTENLYTGVASDGSTLGTLKPRRQQFANLSGWELKVPSQGIGAHSRDEQSWLEAAISDGGLDAEFTLPDASPVLRVREFFGEKDTWEVLSPPYAGIILDWRMASCVAVALIDIHSHLHR